MKFLLAVIDSVSGSATGDEAAAIDEFNDYLESNGHWIYAAGIGAPSTATVFDNRGDAGIEIPGSFANGDEFMSGFWLINAESETIAAQLAAAGSRACNRKVELRPFLR